jgi:hypothetical protein
MRVLIVGGIGVVEVVGKGEEEGVGVVGKGLTGGGGGEISVACETEEEMPAGGV